MKEINIGQATALTSPDPLVLVCTRKEDGGLNMAPVSFFMYASFEPPMLVFVQSKERARQLFAEVAYESGAREEVTSRRERRRHPQRYVAQGAAGGRHTLPHR